MAISVARFALFLPKKTETMKKTCALEISYLRYLVCIFTRYFFLALLQATHNFYIAKLCSDVGFFSLCSLEMALSRKLCQTLVYAQPHGKSLVLASNEKKNVNRLSLCTHATPIDI